MIRRALAAGGCLASLLCWAAAPVRSEEPILAQAFEVRYRPLADVAELVGPILSPEGELTLRPRLNTLVVEDRASVLRRVEALVRDFDLPPRNIEVTLSLFLGTERRDEAAVARGNGAALSKEVRGVIETLGDFTKWTSYEPLGSRSITGVEGDPVTVNLSEDYRVSFVVGRVHDAQGVVKFERFSLQKVMREADGTERLEELYTTGMVLKVGRLQVVGAASGAESNRALFLTLQAETR